MTSIALDGAEGFVVQDDGRSRILLDDEYSTRVLADSAFGYWQFGEPSGAVATDFKRLNNGNYGTAVLTYGNQSSNNPATTTSVQCVGSDATGITFPFGIVGLNAFPQISLEMWMLRGDPSVAGDLFADGGGGVPQMNMHVGTSGGAPVFQSSVFNSVGATVAFANSAIVDSASDPDDLWTATTGNIFAHFVTTVDKTNGVLTTYVNGRLGTTVTGWSPVTVIADAGLIPAVAGNGAAFGGATGLYANFSVYHSILTADKVYDHYRSGSIGDRMRSSDVFQARRRASSY